ncbi:MAG: prolipoprotein diacylglyceryl transferase [Chlamydiae bacterium]|nr:prolipoprotein diacylglyceryl transferase [Chlamydiota bacterium]MBI3276735.1 prolipoprotein diacylglyceryl transferase [Chlamydiota bacterium]
MKSILFKLGTITLYSYGAMMALGFFLGVIVLRLRSQKMGIPRQKSYDLGIGMMIGGLMGARVFYVATHWHTYFHHPLEIIMIQKGGLAFYGGLMGGILAIKIFSYTQNFPFLKIADLVIIALVPAHAIGRIGCFMNGCCFGRPTKMPWAVNFPQGSLPALHYGPHHLIHPVQLYEAWLLTFLFWFLLWIDQRKTFEGETFIFYLMLYPVLRFSMEFFRGDNPLIGALSIFQWMSLGTAGFALIYFYRSKRDVRRNH